MSAVKSNVRWRSLPAAALPEFAGAWDAINAGAFQSPLLTSQFVSLLLKHFGSGTERLVIAEDAAGPVALGVLQRQSAASWQTFQPSQGPVGAWIQRPELSMQDLARGLFSALPVTALVVGITQQDPDMLARPPDRAGFRTLDYIRTARVPVSGTFDEYWQQRGSNLRQNMRRQRHKLAREKVATRLEVIRDAEAIGAAVDDYGRVESSGWKGKEGTALHPDNTQGRFYRDLLTSFARTGDAAVFRYFFDSKLVATDLCIFHGGTLALLKTTHAEEVSKLSPTMLMREESFRMVFDTAMCRRIEFYGMLMEWHTRWADDIRTMYHLNAWRWPWVERLARRARKPAESAKDAHGGGASPAEGGAAG